MHEAYERRTQLHEWAGIATMWQYKELIIKISHHLESTQLDTHIWASFIITARTDPSLQIDPTKSRSEDENNKLFTLRKKMSHTLMIDYVNHKEEKRINKRRTWIWTVIKWLTWTFILWASVARDNIDKYNIYEHTHSHPDIPQALDGWKIVNCSDIHMHQDNRANIDEWRDLPRYIKRVNTHLEKTNTDVNKVILLLPWDIVSQKSGAYEESERSYVEKHLPTLKLLPWTHRYVVFGNHDEINSHTNKLREWFKNNWFIVLDDPETPEMYAHKLDIQWALIEVMWMPSYICRKDEYTPERKQELIKRTQKNNYTIFPLHNLDGAQDVLYELENTIIFSWHTHRLHANIPIIRSYARDFLKYKSEQYMWHKTYPNNVHVDICAGLNNSSSIPFRAFADPWVSITTLSHQESIE